jgi:hypothetical protein
LADPATKEPVTLYQARVKVANTEVRGKPGTDERLYPTNRLPRDAVVEIVEELPDGWLAIKPPAQSYSLIPKNLVEPIKKSRNWVVLGNDSDSVSVVYGAAEASETRLVAGVRVPRGHQVTQIGEERLIDGITWLVIEPPPTEVRYLRQDAVEKIPGRTVSGLTGPAPAPSRGTSVPFVPVSYLPEGESPAVSRATANDFPDDPRIQEAQRAEATGDRRTAISLWTQLGKDYVNTNNRFSNYCFNQVPRLQQPPAPAANPSGPVQLQAPMRVAPDGRTFPLPTASPDRPAPVVTNQRAWVPVPTDQASPPARQTSYLPGSAPAPAATPGYVGHLTRAGRWLDYQPTYRLESSDARSFMYVTAQPGVNLEAYVDRNVEITGPVSYRGESRAYTVLAAQVRPLP